MSLLHIRGAQPSQKLAKKKKAKNFIQPLSNLHKNVQKIISTKKNNSISNPSFGINTMMDQKCFKFFMENFRNTNVQTRIPINTQECKSFLNKFNVDFVSERAQELANAKVLFTTKSTRRRYNATFIILLPIDYNFMLIILILLKLDFGILQIEMTANIGRQFEQFMQKAKACGFRYYYELVQLNLLNERFIIVRS